jgi:hypothetical protein
MAKLVYGLSQSLDGYVDHMKLGPPPAAAARHFLDLMGGLTGLVYGRRTYEIMRYWDEDLPDWDAEDREVRGGVPEQAEVGRFGFPRICWPECQTGGEWLREGDTQPES